MPTKLFDTVNTYSDAAVNASRAELLLIDLGDADVTVTFPAAATVGQCIGIQIAVASAGNACTGAGPVDMRPFPLEADGECALWAWDGSTWQSVSQYHAAGSASAWLAPNTSTSPTNAQLAVISGAPETVVLPEAPANGTYVAVKSTNGTVTVEASGADSIDLGNGGLGSSYLLATIGAGAVFVYSAADSVWWVPAVLDTRPRLNPTQETTDRTLALSDMGLLIEMTSGGILTVPAQATVEWPSDASFDIVAVATPTTVVGAVGVEIKVPTGSVAAAAVPYARLRLERLYTTDEWVLSGQLEAAP